MSFMNFGQIVIGPAGSGKSTYCTLVQQNADILQRKVIVVNLDPANETFKYTCDIDIKDLITLDDAMEEMELGPNGGLVFCMEYLYENFNWLEDELQKLYETDYILFDCPGQIELYAHLPVMKNICNELQRIGFSLCSLYMVDCTFLVEEEKFISGNLIALSSMINLGLPHLTILSKCDLVKDEKTIQSFLEPKPMFFDQFQPIRQKKKGEKEKNSFKKKYGKLTKEIQDVIHDYGLIQHWKLNIQKPDTLKSIIYQADLMIQYRESLESKESTYTQAESKL